jgi:hypothetical protein
METSVISALQLPEPKVLRITHIGVGAKREFSWKEIGGRGSERS